MATWRGERGVGCSDPAQASPEQMQAWGRAPNLSNARPRSVPRVHVDPGASRGVGAWPSMRAHQPHDRRVSGEHLVGSDAVTEPASSIPSAEDRPGLARGRYVPALLTVLVPGLGHLVAGRLRLAALFGLPLVFLAALAVGVLAATTTDQLVGALLDDRVLVLVLALAGRPARLAAPGARLRRSPTGGCPGCACATRCRSSRSSSWWPRPQAYAGVVSQAVRESANDVFARGRSLVGSLAACPDALVDAAREPRSGRHARAVADALAVADRDAGGRAGSTC